MKYEIVFRDPIVQDPQDKEYLRTFNQMYGDPQDHRLVDDVNDGLILVFGAFVEIDWRDEKTVVISGDSLEGLVITKKE